MTGSELGRREALQLGMLGGALALCPPMIANAAPLPRTALRLEERKCQLIVMGGGVAGVMAALAARQAGANVILIEKTAVGLGGMTPWAQNWRDPRGREARLADQLLAEGDGLTDRAWLEMTLGVAGEVAGLWENWGWLDTAPLRRRALWLAQLKSAGVEVYEHSMVARFLRDRDGRFAGVLALRPQAREGDMVLIRAARGVSAMGSGALRGPHAMLWGLTHDGVALSFQAGARLRGKELTDLSSPYAAYAALADVSAQQPARMAEAATAGLAQPDVNDLLAEMRGLRPLPNSSAPMRMPGTGVLTSEGVVAAALDGAVEGVPGLHAAGGALASMVSGGRYSLPGLGWTASGAQGQLVGAAAGRLAAQLAPAIPDADRLDATLTEVWGPRVRAQGYGPDWVRQNLQQSVTPFFVSYWKQADRLVAAQTLVDHLATALQPMLIASSNHEWRAVLEVQNLLIDQQVRLRASLARRESRGTHVREDAEAQTAPSWIDASRDAGGEIVLRQAAVSTASSPG